MNTPNLVKCRICGEEFDPDEEGAGDDRGRWAHEACFDAEEADAQNAPDCDPFDYAFQD